MYKIYYKKHLGQHFLIDKNIAQKIVKNLSFNEYKTVVEVGPGMGILSYYLIKCCNDLFLIEIDHELVIHLQNNYLNLLHRIIQADFLKWDPKSLGLSCFALIGNFPYNISSQILFRLLDLHQYIPECIGMFQKEVAERIVSNNNKKSYGILSVLIQAFYKVEYLFTVNENVFSPKPKVKSAVIRLSRKNYNINCNKILFFKLVKFAFHKRRKILRNSLKPLCCSKNFYSLPILNKRAEQLSVEDFIKLTNIMNI